MKKHLLTILILFSLPLCIAAQSLGNFTSLTRTPTGVNLETDHGQVQLSVYGPEIIRVRIDHTFADDFSYAVVAKPVTEGFTVDETGEHITLRTPSLVLEVLKKPVRFRLLNANGQILNEDDTFGTHWVGSEVTTYKKMQPDEKFVGLGEKTGNLNRRGEGYMNWNSDVPAYPVNQDPLYASFPFYIGVHHKVVYGIYFDNVHKTYFNFGASNDRFSSFGAESGEMNYYYIGGSDIAAVIKNYSHLTGFMPMPPIWSLGNQQSRWSYFPDSEVLNIASTFVSKKIPLDVIYLDIHYMDAYKIFTWDKTRFPDPKAMTGKLKDMGIKTTVIIDPGIKVEKGYEAYEQGVRGNLFLKYPDGTNYTAQVWPGWCHFPDFSLKAARDWWGKSFKPLVDDGVKGFWNDMNEIASWGGGKIPSLVEFSYEGKKAPYPHLKNAYGLLMTRSTYEGTRQLMQERPFLLTRAAFSGSQRYTAIWTGDNVGSEEHMMLGIRLVNSLGLTGMPFAGVDVGGFMGDASRSLFTRWISIGAFTPFLRVHKHYDYLFSEPWSYGADAENIARNYISLRYKLLPYLYSVFYEAHTTGMPVSRSIILDNTFDEKAWAWAYMHQYMFGPAIMVAPVESTKETVKAYLPHGNWYDMFTGQPYRGLTETLLEAPLDKLPLLVKAGSIIPMQKAVQHTGADPGDTLTVHVYYGTTRNTFTYYEDDGISFANEKGRSLVAEMVYDPGQRMISIPVLARNTQNTYTGKFRKVQFVLHGFGNIRGLKNGESPVETSFARIDMLNMQTPGTAQWLNSRKWEQEVVVTEAFSTAKPVTLTW